MIIWIILLLIGIITAVIFCYALYYDYDTASFITAIFGACYIIILFSALTATVAAHATAGANITKANITYENLIYRIKCQDGNLIDTTLYSDIQTWNADAAETKYWAYNVWTSWFNSRAYADSLNYIYIEEVLYEERD